MSNEGNQGVIRFKVEDYASLTKAVQSKPVEIGNIPWTLEAFSSKNERTNNVKHLGVSLICNALSESNLWSCEASIRISLLKLNSNDAGDAFSVNYEKKFDLKRNQFIVDNFKNWEESINYDNRFMLGEHVVLEAHITVKKVEGVHEKILKTFAEPHEHLTDVALIVEGKKVHVGKQILAQQSEFFRALFYSDFSENDKKEIVIEDVVHSEFIDFLNFIYPTHKTMDEKNVAHVLKLADRFHADFVLEKAEKYLLTSNEVALVNKFKFAETYKLSELQNHCLSKLESTAEVLKLYQFDDFKSLGDLSRFVLLEKVVDLLKKEKPIESSQTSSIG